MCAKAVRSAELRTIPSSEAVQLLRAACPTTGAGGSMLAPGGGEAGAAADAATTTTVLDPDAAKWSIMCFIYLGGSHFSEF